MNAHLQTARLHDPRLHAMSDAFRGRLHGLSIERCQLHPQGRDELWSSQDVIEHLILTFRGTIAQVEKYRRRGSASSRKPRLREAMARTVVVTFGHFPRGVPAPEFVCPGRQQMTAMSGDALADLFEQDLGLLDAELERCEGLFQGQKFAAHFRLGPLSPQQWRRFHLVHGYHHLAQLDRIEKWIALSTGQRALTEKN